MSASPDPDGVWGQCARTPNPCTTLIYGLDPAQVRGGPIGPDTLARIKQRYRAEGPTPSNCAHGYVAAG